MTRWLQAAKQETGIGTKLTEPTKHNQREVKNADNPTHERVLSVLSILSEGERAEAAPVPADRLTPDAAAYLAHLRKDGPHSYGAMARKLGWGATRAWQAEARLRAAGRIRFRETDGKGAAQ